MKIGLVSDSHGNIENLRRAYREAKDKHHCELFFHLGDDYHDINKAGITDTEKVFRVPGVFHPKYQTGELEPQIIKEIEGFKILLTHSHTPHKNDPDKIINPDAAAAKGEFDIILFGHTHVPDISANEKNVIFVNPGHLKDEDKKGYPPSFAVLELKPGKIIVKIFSLSYEDILFEKEFSR